ncbi:MAG: hypothetical protein GDA48_08725 [Hormoscilla sp. GM102CHS1]|nr:hypothetical protein [Hormoscilla sp. GM102CHS1]
MDRAEQIARELEALEKEIEALAAEFHQTYSEYLKSLGQVVRQGLILASYHLCTQGYPDQFLRLSLNNKQKLQQGIRQVASQAQPQLLAQLHPPGQPAQEKPKETNVEAFLPGLLNQPSENILGGTNRVLPQEEKPQEKITPMDLAQWQDKLEKAIASTLDTVSRQTNLLLKQGNILPNHQLPESIVEAAKSAASSSETVPAGSPNIINMLIEAEGPGKKKKEEGSGENPASTSTGKRRMPIGIVEIHLRLSELEFADSTASSWRQKIRNLKTQLQTLGRKYQKKQRERAVALAEAAWRSSWFDE